MSSERTKPSTVVPFRPAHVATPEVSIAVARRAGAGPALVTTEPGVDLSGKPKIVFLIGRGGSGKSVAARWMIERGQAAERRSLLAAMDPVNRTLVDYFRAGVSQPDSSDPVESAGFLRDLLGFAIEGQHSAVIDLGGGDTTLATVLQEMPNLADVFAEAGMAAVALYMLAPRIDDLAPFLSLNHGEQRFQPAATAFVCNQGAQNGSFGPLLEQSVIRHAIEGGARVVHMPGLDRTTSAWIEQRRMLFGAAGRNEADAEGARIGTWRATLVRSWLWKMDSEFERIGTWLP